jgi:peptide/nickel transport system ATP-binding protein
MDRLRYKELSIIPQYAMSALNPTRRIRTITRDLLKTKKVRYSAEIEEFRRRLDLVGLDEKVLRQYPIELSGGMKQRIVMVISTLLNPSLLIADEITSALDVSTQRAVGEMIIEFRDRGYVKSVMVITHDLSILAQISTTILVMYAGKLAEKASADTIINAPLHPYTQLLISSLPEVGVRYEDRVLSGIVGTPPSLLDPPEGCRFHDRRPGALRGVLAAQQVFGIRRRRSRRPGGGRRGGLSRAEARQGHEGLQYRGVRVCRLPGRAAGELRDPARPGDGPDR